MTPDALRELFLSLPQAFESFPFGPQAAVFKVSANEKMFGLLALDSDPLTITVKCDPDDSRALQEEFEQITPGYHMNKKHWITVVVEGLPDELVGQLVRDSYTLVAPRIRSARS